MRTAHAVIFCGTFLVAASVATFAQDRSDKPTTPKKGDTVVVKGCLQGPVLTSTETAALDETLMTASALTYQLKGDKNLLRQLREQHDGQLVEVTGVLKSHLPQPDARRGKQVGKTRIIVGGGTSSMDRMTTPGIDQPQPVLEVKSFEGKSIDCRR
jgi:hypothetical protein